MGYQPRFRRKSLVLTSTFCGDLRGAFSRAVPDFRQDGLEVLEELLRVFTHREVADASHIDAPGAGDLVHELLSFLEGRGEVPLTVHDVDCYLGGVDILRLVPEVVLDAIVVQVALEHRRRSLAIDPDRL